MMRLVLRRLFAFPGHGKVLACRDVIPMLSEFIDQELDPEMLGKIREHLDLCAACRRFTASLDQTARMLRADPSAAIPDEAARELMAHLRQAYRRACDELDEHTSA